VGWGRSAQALTLLRVPCSHCSEAWAQTSGRRPSSLRRKAHHASNFHSQNNSQCTGANAHSPRGKEEAALPQRRVAGIALSERGSSQKRLATRALIVVNLAPLASASHPGQARPCGVVHRQLQASASLSQACLLPCSISAHRPPCSMPRVHMFSSVRLASLPSKASAWFCLLHEP
jgi:hypothetical protein